MSEGQIDASVVEAALKEFKDPETGRSVVRTGQIGDVQVDGDQLTLELALTTWAAPLWDETREALLDTLHSAFPQLESIGVQLKTFERPPAKQGEIGLTVKNVIAVGSGKGGVGKSTVAASLALGLNRAGCKVGLMDADVYGPSVPHLLGVAGKPEVVDGKMKPIEKDGLPVMSIGFFVPPEQAVVWRGPMLHQSVTQFLRDVNWGELDYLIVDMPPGTGDVALSLAQLLPVSESVIVCTPQDVALLDAVKAVSMMRQVNIPVLGMVENMSGFVCPDCGKKYDIFGSGGARQRAEDMNIPFLGEIPITIAMRENGDAGRTEANYDDPSLAGYLQGICYRLVKGLAIKAAAAPPKPQLPVLG